MKNIISLCLVLFIFSACENRAGNQETPPPSPVTSQPQSNPVQPGVIPASQPAQNSNVALNPKHGQPGHRCDIPEGAPLNSAPAGQPAPIQQPVMQPNLTSPVLSQPVPGGNVKLNPPHGQPGHDCAIAVGQPLRK